MKKNLQKKLSAFIIITMMFSTTTHAQIVYTDVNPDLVASCSVPTSPPFNCSNSKNIDLNNDSITDFNFYVYNNYQQWGGSGGGFPCSQGTKYADAYSKNLNAIACDTNGPLAMNGNFIISSSLSWNDTTVNQGYNRLAYYHRNTCPSYVFSSNGSWIGQTDKYLALSIIKNGLKYYGWAKMSINSSPSAYSIVIKEYAYNSIPNQPILAGETICTTPTVTLSASGSLSFCNGDSVTLTANGTGYKYQWKKGGVNITGATSQTYIAKTAGTYKCKVTNSCGNITSAGKTVTVPCRLTNEVFVEQLENPFEIKIAPNPLSNSSIISFTLEQSQKVSLKIFDLNGRLIKTLTENILEEGEHQIEFNAEKLNAGIYFLSIQTAEFLQTKKLIVSK